MIGDLSKEGTAPGCVENSSALRIFIYLIMITCGCYTLIDFSISVLTFGAKLKNVCVCGG